MINAEIDTERTQELDTECSEELDTECSEESDTQTSYLLNVQLLSIHYVYSNVLSDTKITAEIQQEKNVSKNNAKINIMQKKALSTLKLLKNEKLETEIIKELMNTFYYFDSVELESVTKIIAGQIKNLVLGSSLEYCQDNVEIFRNFNDYDNNPIKIQYEPKWGEGSSSMSVNIVNGLLSTEKPNVLIPAPWICDQKLDDDMVQWFHELSYKMNTINLY